MMAVPLVTPCKSSPLSILKPKSSEVISSIYSRIQLIQHLQNVVAPNIFHPRIVYDCRALAYPLKSSPLSILVYGSLNISKMSSPPISSTLALYMIPCPCLSVEVISSIYSHIQLIQHLQNVIAPNIFHPRIVYDVRALAYPLKSSLFILQLIQHLQNVVAPNIFHPRIVYDGRALAYPLKSSPLSILVYSSYNISKMSSPQYLPPSHRI